MTLRDLIDAVGCVGMFGMMAVGVWMPVWVPVVWVGWAWWMGQR